MKETGPRIFILRFFVEYLPKMAFSRKPINKPAGTKKFLSIVLATGSTFASDLLVYSHKFYDLLKSDASVKGQNIVKMLRIYKWKIIKIILVSEQKRQSVDQAFNAQPLTCRGCFLDGVLLFPIAFVRWLRPRSKHKRY